MNIKASLVYVGGFVMGVASLMVIFVALFFTAVNPLPPFWDAVGGICFYGAIPTGFVGGVLLVVGHVWKKKSPASISD